MKRHQSHLLSLASMSIAALAAGSAHAGSYQKVNQSDWGAGASGLPTYVNMYTFVPTTVASKPPIVVVPHHCQGTASSSHSEMSSLESIADKSGFVIIYPEATGQNCWDAGSTRSLKHGGGGDTGAIVQMVKYTVSKYSGDANRVYTVGGSSGGIMTEALLGVYPDVFMAGISIMGVPCGCWAKGYNDTTGSGSTAQWAGDCAGGKVTNTGKQWGDLVRSYFPGYTGHRPRLQHWHGTSDTTLAYSNMAEDIKEWTNLLDLSETPSGTENNTPKSGTTHQFWKNSCYTVYETFALSGVGHAVSVDGATIAAYFGVDKAGSQDPETAACPGAVPGGGAGGASGGTGGSLGGTGGASGTGGSAGNSGKDGGPTPQDGGRDQGSSEVGTEHETGGSLGAGGGQGSPDVGAVGGKGGSSGAGGGQGTGGGPGAGGRTGAGGGGDEGGNSGRGGASGNAGGGTTSVKGSGGSENGGSGGTGGSGKGGSGGSSETRADRGSSGCAIGGHSGPPASTLAALLLALLFRRRRGRQT